MSIIGAVPNKKDAGKSGFERRLVSKQSGLCPYNDLAKRKRILEFVGSDLDRTKSVLNKLLCLLSRV